jgi:pyruvate-formate lyase-activating enzyme
MKSKTTDTRAIIFYGGGNEAKLKLATWKAAGLVPVCFADADERKHYTKFNVETDGYFSEGGEGYDILPLNVAIERFPDYMLYLTLGHEKLKMVYDYLVEQGISEENIKFADDLYYGYGCHRVGHWVNIFERFISFCCLGPKFDIDPNADAEFVFNKIRKYTDDLVNDIRLEKEENCKECCYCKLGCYESKPKIQCVAFQSIPGLSYCNTKCSYCYHYPKPTDDQCKKNKRRILSLLKYAYASCDPNNFRVHFCDGEIAVSSYRNEALMFCRENNIQSDILTNATVYRKEIAELLSLRLTRLYVTLDTTNKEKYTKIKGVNGLSKVMSNLKKYAQYGKQIILKWIILEQENDTEEDVDGLIAFALELGDSLVNIELSGNANKTGVRLSKNAFSVLSGFVKKCKERNLSYRFLEYSFNKHDLEALQRFNESFINGGTCPQTGS